ncbi:MAG: NAD(P)-dependent oxidoreductase [Acidimicrobiales bacterium]|nr:NAD(P)-dependent oxidoreductase [Acidimicrobiales bacterium]
MTTAPSRILVTGGSGFIGTNLVEHLSSLGHVVGNLDVVAPRNHGHADRWRPTDLLDAGAVLRTVTDFAPEVIVHLGARTDLGGDSLDDYRVNADGVRHVVDAAKATPAVQRVLFGSSQLVSTPGRLPAHDLDYRPPNPYGESKVIGEEIVRAEAGDAFTWILLRPTSIWGPWFGELYSAFFRTVQKGRYLHPRGVRIRKSFGYVGNAVHQLERIVEAPAEAIHGRVVYLADYEAYPIYEWAQIIAAEFGRRGVREVPLGVLRLLACGGDALKLVGVDHPPLSSYRLRNILTETVFPMEPLRALCGDLPYSLAEGTRLTAQWLRDHPDDL